MTDTVDVNTVSTAVLSARGPNEALIGVPGSRSQLSTPALVLDLDLLEMHLAELLKNKEHYRAIIRQNLDAIQFRVKQHEQELLSEIL